MSNHSYVMRALFLLLLGFMAGRTATAQTATDPNEGSRLTYDSLLGSYAFSWWGQPGRTYFLQHSDNLLAWEYLPLIESGTAAPRSWGFTSTGAKFFLRLRVSDIPTSDPFNADFDGDKISNYAELLNGTDPLHTADTDGDGLPDDWEIAYGLNRNDPADAVQTAAGGGMTNLQHFDAGTNPNNAPPPPTITAGTAIFDLSADTLLYPTDDSQLLLKNGNFSAPALGSAQWLPYPTGIANWTAISGQIIELQQIEANLGGQYCELDSHWPPGRDQNLPSDHGIQQPVNLARGHYLLIFDYRGRRAGADSFTAKLKNAGSSTEVVLATKTAASTTAWKRASITFEVAGGNPNSTTLPVTFLFDIADGTDSTGNPDSFGAYIDNVILLPAELMVDASRDGEMSFTDATIHDKDGTTAEKPYRFWLNDDQDVQTNSIAWSDPDPETIPVVTKDYSDSNIQSTRDLEDFTRLWINFQGLTGIVKGSGVELKLEWKPNDGSANWPADAGNPGIKVYLAVEANGGRKYLEDETWAGQQFSNPYYRMLADVHRGTVATFPIRQNQDNDTLNYVWQNRLQNLSESNPYIYLLFEGSAEGKGQLVLTLHQGGQKLVEYPPLFLDIKNIKKMYVRGHTTPLPANFPFPYAQGTPPSFPYVAATSGALFIPYANVNFGLGNGDEPPNNLPFEKPPDEEKKCIVFVHGISMSIHDYHCYSESGFKRLWWAGYKGRYCAFRWGTPVADGVAADIFNDGEMRAWSYGPSLLGYVGHLQGEMPGARISLIGHSLGNAVIGSAFEQSLVVDSYVAMEAAVSLSCYFPPAVQGQADPLASSFLQPLTAADANKPTPNNYPELGYRGYLRNLANGIQGKVTAYQNIDDFWLATGRTAPIMHPIIDEVDWVTNQKNYKPNDLVGPKAYEFHPDRAAGLQCVLGIAGFNNDRLVQDPHEAMAYIARSRTPALGAEPQDRNPRPAGWAPSVDMKQLYKFDRPRPDHSGQFQRNIQRMYSDENGSAFDTPFYERLLQDLNLNQE